MESGVLAGIVIGGLVVIGLGYLALKKWCLTKPPPVIVTVQDFMRHFGPSIRVRDHIALYEKPTMTMSTVPAAKHSSKVLVHADMTTVTFSVGTAEAEKGEEDDFAQNGLTAHCSRCLSPNPVNLPIGTVVYFEVLIKSVPGYRPPRVTKPAASTRRPPAGRVVPAAAAGGSTDPTLDTAGTTGDGREPLADASSTPVHEFAGGSDAAPSVIAPAVISDADDTPAVSDQPEPTTTAVTIAEVEAPTAGTGTADAPPPTAATEVTTQPPAPSMSTPVVATQSSTAVAKSTKQTPVYDPSKSAVQLLVGWVVPPYPEFAAIGDHELFSLGLAHDGTVHSSKLNRPVSLVPGGFKPGDVVGCGFEHVADVNKIRKSVVIGLPAQPGIVFFFTLNGQKLPPLPNVAAVFDHESLNRAAHLLATGDMQPVYSLLALGVAAPAASVAGKLSAVEHFELVSVKFNFLPPFMWPIGNLAAIHTKLEEVRKDRKQKALTAELQAMLSLQLFRPYKPELHPHEKTEEEQAYDEAMEGNATMPSELLAAFESKNAEQQPGEETIDDDPEARVSGRADAYVSDAVQEDVAYVDERPHQHHHASAAVAKAKPTPTKTPVYTAPHLMLPIDVVTEPEHRRSSVGGGPHSTSESPGVVVVTNNGHRGSVVAVGGQRSSVVGGHRSSLVAAGHRSSVSAAPAGHRASVVAAAGTSGHRSSLAAAPAGHRSSVASTADPGRHGGKRSSVASVVPHDPNDAAAAAAAATHAHFLQHHRAGAV